MCSYGYVGTGTMEEMESIKIGGMAERSEELGKDEKTEQWRMMESKADWSKMKWNVGLQVAGIKGRRMEGKRASLYYG